MLAIASFIIRYLGWQARECNLCNLWVIATNPLGVHVRFAEDLAGTRLRSFHRTPFLGRFGISVRSPRLDVVKLPCCGNLRFSNQISVSVFLFSEIAVQRRSRGHT
jgi:hypothetical protein